MKVMSLPANGLKVMICGPMTGLPDFNRPQFNEVAEKLYCKGFTVYNPTVLPAGWSHEQYMEVTLRWTDEVDAIYMLDGWERSKGAVMEFDRILRHRLPLMQFQTLDAFRVAVERSQKLKASLVHQESGTGGHQYAER